MKTDYQPNALFNLQGRCALITGGSRGLGLQMARALGAAGARVMLVARKADSLQEAAESLKAEGIETDWIAADVSEEQTIVDLAANTLSRLGRVDILVNNAGCSWGAPAEDYPAAGWDKVFNLNMRGQFLLSREIGKHCMIPNRYGRILNISSMSGLKGVMPEVMQAISYTTSKAALIGYTRSLAAEWGRYGITVNALAPGFFPSKLTKGTIEQVGEDQLTQNVPLHRLGGDEDLMGSALLFASNAGAHITGQVLAIDGGASIV
ncbi:MAG: SDR family oxidoreductase [Panacagrimonas sp.]